MFTTDFAILFLCDFDKHPRYKKVFLTLDYQQLSINFDKIISLKKHYQMFA